MKRISQINAVKRFLRVAGPSIQRVNLLRSLIRHKRAAKRKSSPRFDPHFSGMIFLGRYERWDLWYVPKAANVGIEPSIDARWGSEGYMYMSGMCFGWIPGRPKHPLVVARQRAEARGLDVCRSQYENTRRGANGVLYQPGQEEQFKETFGEAV